MMLAMELVDELELAGAILSGHYTTLTSALRFLGSGPLIDVAVLDVRLNGELSFPIAEELVRQDIPLLFVTANDDIAREAFPDVPCHAKPIVPAVLIDTIALLATTSPRLIARP